MRETGVIESFDFRAGAGVIRLDDGRTLAFDEGVCAFKPFVHLRVIVEQEGERAIAVRLGPDAFERWDEINARRNREALEERERRRAEEPRRSWQPVNRDTLERPWSCDPELEARLEADPDDDGALEVYADLLQQRGERVGELIMVERMLPHSPHDARESLDEQRYELRNEVFGELEDHDHCLRLRWHDGLVRSVDVFVSRHALEGAALDPLARLLSHPAGRFVRGLSVAFEEDDDVIPDLGEILDLLQRARWLRSTLRSLVLGDPAWSVFSFAHRPPAYGSLAALEALTITGAPLELGVIELPRLRRLDVQSHGLTAANLAAIVRAAGRSALERLTIGFGTGEAVEGESVVADLEHLLPLLESPPPALTALGLCNAPFADALCEVLPRTPMAAAVAELDLSGGAMTDTGAHRLVARAAQLRHLERLSVESNLLSEEGVAALARIGCQVRADGQRRDAEGSVEIQPPW